MAVDASTRFLMARFSKHYRMSSLFVPDRFSKREFGFMFYDRDFVIRHLGFPTRAALKNYLIEQAPAHAYYSCAYYEKPDAPTMAEKHWLGADLIFDLDADHVEGTKGLPYHEMLERVKQEVKRLLDEFIMGDLGFGGEELRIAFSGGRGYHIHVTSPRVLRLTSHERREIVDYVTGTGLEPELLGLLDTEGRLKVVGGPHPSDSGWRGRIARGIMQVLLRTDAFELREMGLKSNTIESLIRLRGEADAGTISWAEIDGAGRRTWQIIVRKAARLGAVSIDTVVTSDIHRLIRLPETLNGKTGLKAMHVKIGELATFSPLTQAAAFEGEETVYIKEAPRFMIGSKGYGPFENVEVALPTPAALLLMCKGKAYPVAK
ncbi:MAG: DNA primase catalytic subunit PriS [Candidatus Bathyarchaeia archaeon]